MKEYMINYLCECIIGNRLSSEKFRWHCFPSSLGVMRNKAVFRSAAAYGYRGNSSISAAHKRPLLTKLWIYKLIQPYFCSDQCENQTKLFCKS